MVDYEIREYRSGDERTLLETFNLVFGRKDPGFRDRTLDEWRWGFLDNPAGWRIYVALANGRVVAQFAGTPMRVVVDGADRTFVHCVDSMSHPDHRKGLKRPGLFVNVANAYFDAYGGEERDWVHFGLPIEEAARIGDRFLEYEVLRNQIFLVREPGDGSTALPPGVEVLDAFDDDVARVWRRCNREWGASAVRDAAFMTWRYLEHPRNTYVPFGVRDDAGALRGLAVYRRADWIVPNAAFAVDWLVPPDEAEVGELLVQAFLAKARADRASLVAISAPEWSRWFSALQDRGFLVHPSDYFVRVRTFHPEHGVHWLRRAWWYQPGETDLL